TQGCGRSLLPPRLSRRQAAPSCDARGSDWRSGFKYFVSLPDVDTPDINTDVARGTVLTVSDSFSRESAA
ncbi:MAG TPA: hypothetical protein VKZ59_04375, partial [Acidobacteriota bacterium]|nr:hypothetical protein [Acidobacteriota bacterium]